MHIFFISSFLIIINFTTLSSMAKKSTAIEQIIAFDQSTQKEFAKQATTALFQACKDYNLRAACAALDLGAEINNYDVRGFTPLLYACNFNYPFNAGNSLITQTLERQQQLVIFLLKSGADVNQRSKDGRYTALAVASYGIGFSGEAYNDMLIKILELNRAFDEHIADLAANKKKLIQESALTPYLQSPLSWFEILSMVVSSLKNMR